MEENKFSLEEFSSKINAELNTVKDFCKRVGVNADELENALDQTEPVSLVFAGQYSAGKSTIIRALTHDPTIVSGLGVTTTETHCYNWNGLNVIDTPGICTGRYSDHDEKAQRAIANADMLVYVVTEDLFDDLIGNNFRRIIIDEKKADETFLVVNKMADCGNYEEIREIKRKDIAKVTAPYTPEDLHTSFIDTEEYLNSLRTSNEWMRKDSNFDDFIGKLNNFAADDGFRAKLTSPLYKAVYLLKEVKAGFDSENADLDTEKVIEVLRRRKKIISDSLRQAKSSSMAVAEEIISHIRDSEESAVKLVTSCKDQAEFESRLMRINDEIRNTVDSGLEKIGVELEKSCAECEEKIKEFQSGDFFRSIMVEFNLNSGNENQIAEKFLKSDAVSSSCKFLAANSVGDATKNGLLANSGSNIHTLILDSKNWLNSTFNAGIKLKPWQAVKMAKGINIAGKAIGVAGAVLQVFLQVKDDIDEEKHNDSIDKARSEIREQFENNITEIRSQTQKSIKEFLDENQNAWINGINADINKAESARSERHENENCADKLILECMSIIEEINTSARRKHEQY